MLGDHDIRRLPDGVVVGVEELAHILVGAGEAGFSIDVRRARVDGEETAPGGGAGRAAEELEVILPELGPPEAPVPADAGRRGHGLEAVGVLACLGGYSAVVLPDGVGVGRMGLGAGDFGAARGGVGFSERVALVGGALRGRLRGIGLFGGGEHRGIFPVLAGDVGRGQPERGAVGRTLGFLLLDPLGEIAVGLWNEVCHRNNNLVVT